MGRASGADSVAMGNHLVSRLSNLLLHHLHEIYYTLSTLWSYMAASALPHTSIFQLVQMIKRKRKAYLLTLNTFWESHMNFCLHPIG